MELKTGIIIKTSKYKEKDKIAFILTNDKFDSYLIRSSFDFKSKNYSYSNELTKIDFDYNESKKNSFDIVSTGVVNNIYKNIKSNYEVLEIAVELLNLVYKAAEHVGNNNNLYNLLDFCLENLNNYYLDHDVCLLYSFVFKLKLLFLMGVGPHFKSCTICNKNKGLILSLEYGGVVCKNCSGKLSFNDYILTKEVVELIKVLYLGKIDVLNYDLMQEIVNLSKDKNYISEISKFINLYYKKYLSL